MAGEVEASRSVLDAMFSKIPQSTLAREYASIYVEAKNLYAELDNKKKH
jgi:hypothetical protein